MPVIKHESSASPAYSVADLCSSSCDLDELQQTCLLLEDSPKKAGASQSAAAKRQQPSVAQQVRTSAPAARHPPASSGRPADQPVRQPSQAARSDARQRGQPSSQRHASAVDTRLLDRVPLHGPRLPDRPQKRKRTIMESEANPGQPQDPCAFHESSIFSDKPRNGVAPLGETHPQTPPKDTPNPEQQRLTAPQGQCTTREPELAARPTKMPCTTVVKLEHTPFQSSVVDPHTVLKSSRQQSPAAAPLQHQGNLPTQACAVPTKPDNRQLVEAELHVRPEASTPMTELQQVLSLFGADTAVGPAAKESALSQLVMLVADSMYASVFQLCCIVYLKLDLGMSFDIAVLHAILHFICLVLNGLHVTWSVDWSLHALAIARLANPRLLHLVVVDVARLLMPDSSTVHQSTVLQDCCQNSGNHGQVTGPRGK